MIQSSFTGFCPAAIVFKKLGVAGRQRVFVIGVHPIRIELPQGEGCGRDYQANVIPFPSEASASCA